MDRPLLRLNHPRIRVYFFREAYDTVGLLLRERLLIHTLKSGVVVRAGEGGIYRYQMSRVHEKGHFSNWENQLRPYPNTATDWEVAYG